MHTHRISSSENSECHTSCNRAYEDTDEKRVRIAIFIGNKRASEKVGEAKEAKLSPEQYDDILGDSVTRYASNNTCILRPI